MFVWQAERDSTFGIAGCARDEAVAPHTIAPAGSIARPLDRTRGAPDIVVAIPEIGAMAMGWQSYHIFQESNREIPHSRLNPAFTSTTTRRKTTSRAYNAGPPVGACSSEQHKCTTTTRKTTSRANDAGTPVGACVPSMITLQPFEISSPVKGGYTAIALLAM